MIPSLTAGEMKAADALAGKYGVKASRLMENAGKSLAALAAGMLDKEGILSVLSGKGNNGGDGIVAALYLSDAGFRVVLVLAADEVPGGLTGRQLERAGKRRIDILTTGSSPAKTIETAVSSSDLIIDALIGYGLSGNPRGAAADLIRLANSSGRPILSCDLPSGLESDTGEILEPCIRAKATLTMGLPKKGLLRPSAKEAVGELYLADIGIPERIYRELGLEASGIFQKGKKIMKLEPISKSSRSAQPASPGTGRPQPSPRQ